MLLHFDLEFTGLHKNTSLISIGIVDENGREFYAECKDYDKTQIDEWLQKNVIDNTKYLKNATTGKNILSVVDIKNENVSMLGDKLEIRNIFTMWIKNYGNIQFVSDVCHYDMVLLIDLLADSALDLPENISAACHDINQDIARSLKISVREAFDITRETLLDKEIKGDKHNSLYDAKVIREIYNKLNR